MRQATFVCDHVRSKAGGGQAPYDRSPPASTRCNGLMLSGIGGISVAVQVGIQGGHVSDSIYIVTDVHAEYDRNLIVRIGGTSSTGIRSQSPSPEYTSLWKGYCWTFIVA